MHRTYGVVVFSAFLAFGKQLALGAADLPQDHRADRKIHRRAINSHNDIFLALAIADAAKIDHSSQPTLSNSALSETSSSSARVGSSPSKTPFAMVRTTINAVDQSGPINTTEGFERTFTEREIETSVGTFGDPSRFMQLLPGVVSDNDQYNDFIVRGGVSEENLFLVDNIEVPSINHLALSDTTGGFVSMIDNAAIQKLTLHTDAYDSKYDQRLSSIVDISTRPEGKVAPRSEAEIGIAGFGISRTRPLHNDGSVFISARRSVLNLLTNDIGMNGVPIYANSLLRADDHIGDRDSWWGLSLTGTDSIKIRPSATDAWETNPYDINYKGWRNTTGINWQHINSSSSFGVLSLSNSEQSQSVVENAQMLDGATIYSENTSDGTSVAKYDLTFQTNRQATISTGARAAVDRLNYQVNQPLGLQNPYSEDPASLDAMKLSRRFAASSSAVYAEATMTGPHGIKLVEGLRLSHWAILGTTVVTPKVLFMMPLGNNRAIHVGYAVYAQLPPNLYLLSFANQKTLSPIQCEQITAGIDLVHTRTLELSMEGYRKNYLYYPVAQNYPQLSLGNIANTFGQAFLMFPMTDQGSGQGQGAELSFRWRPNYRFMLTSSATYSRIWYSGLDGIRRKGNFDIPFVMNVSGTLNLKQNSMLSFRYTEASGRPYTPDDLELSIAQNRDVYDLTRINALRSPAYHRLDFRFEQKRSFQRGTLTWHVGLENALGVDNFYSYAWRPQCGAQCGGVLEQDQMPRFPDGGIKYTF